MRLQMLPVLAAPVAVLAQGVSLGFNSGATTDSGTIKKQADFEKEFDVAQNLNGAPGTFNSIRLYTNIQGGTEDSPIEAFPAAIKTKTKLLLGIWASGTDNIDKELNALSKAIEEYGDDFTNLVVGLSVGSEDMYRVSEPGIKNKSGVGASADVIVKFIQAAREKLKGTGLSSTPIGHVDTWTAWVNESNAAVIQEADFLGTNLFPYYEDTKDNDISNAWSNFESAISSTEAVAGDKKVWITETGWPVSGPDFGKAEATKDNAKSYWDDVGCRIFNKRNVFWYVLRDSNPDNEAKFAVSQDVTTTPQYNLTCPEIKDTPTPSGGNNSSSNNTTSGNNNNNNNTNNNNTNSDGESNGNTNTNNTGTGNNANNQTSTGNATNGPAEGSSGTIMSVSYMNAGVMVLSAVFALAAWVV